MNFLSAQELYFRYDSSPKWILNNFSIELGAGEVLQIKGDSGSGKTTLLYNLCGVIPKSIKGIQKGSVKIFGKSISKFSLAELSPTMSLLLQNPDQQLFFPSVEQELAFYPENLCLNPKMIEQRISEILEELGIEHLRKRETAFLSYGEKKLVTFASLLTASPRILLLDELFTGISEVKIGLILSLLRKMTRQDKIIIAAGHSDHFAEIATSSITL